MSASRATPAASGGARLCLHMIVKDEAAIIERCLAAAAPAIACYAICDTGSRDDTRERIAAFFASRGIPGEIHALPFVDFGRTRSDALERARASPLAFDYLLLADADMELEIADGRFRDRLQAPAYAVRQHDSLAYWNTRLLRRDVPARYVGATHEYLAVDGAVERLDAIAFADRADGSSRPGKFARDTALLEAALALDANDTRAMFYLAQTHRDAGRHAQALALYRRRAEAGGWDEEVWYALWMAARASLALGDDVAFVDGCLDAYEFRPSRAEPLADLARYYRERGRHETAMLWAEAGARIPYPDDDRLFVDEGVYRHGFTLETSIAGYYSKLPARQAAARAATLELQVARDVPADLRATARRNGLWFAPRADALFRGVVAAPLAIAPEDGYAPANPSVFLDGDALRCIVRTVNYRIDGPDYHYPEVIRTRNLLADLRPDGTLASRRTIGEDALPPGVPTRIRGFEDARLFRWRGRLAFSATVRDRDADERCRIALVTLDEDANADGMTVLAGFGDDEHQKNWMPFVDGDDLSFVYLCDPTIVLRYDERSGRVVPRARHEPSLALEHLRGGSQLVRFDDGWLALAHEVAMIDAGRRRYLHRFLRFDRQLRIDAITEPFAFADEPVEFAAGLAYDTGRDVLFASYGVQDREAWIAQIRAEDLRHALVRLPD